MCADLKPDLLGVGGAIDDANERPANWTAGLRDGNSVYAFFLNLQNTELSQLTIMMGKRGEHAWRRGPKSCLGSAAR